MQNKFLQMGFDLRKIDLKVESIFKSSNSIFFFLKTKPNSEKANLQFRLTYFYPRIYLISSCAIFTVALYPFLVRRMRVQRNFKIDSLEN